MYPGVTRNAYHLYMFRYDPAGFAGLPRAAFLKALRAEGVPASSGYSPLNKEPFLANDLCVHGLPAHLRRGRDQGDGGAQPHAAERSPLRGGGVAHADHADRSTRDMDHIVEAVRKIQKHAGDIARQSD